MAVANAQLVRCMHSNVAPNSGGLANVHWLPDVPAAQLDEVAATLQDPAHAAVTRVCVTRDVDQYVAESYSPAGTPIQFCGHGALAAAWVTLNEHAADEAVLSFSNRRHSWKARCFDSHGADIALTYARPAPLECDIPDFAEACLGLKPVAAAKMGTGTDYLILELEAAAAVQSIQPDVVAIGAATQCALIITARVAGTSAGCVFRYFAPQYGDPEDAATGSAAVQLAAYWSLRLDVAQLTAQQLSSQGATMQLSCHGDVVELAARVGYV